MIGRCWIQSILLVFAFSAMAQEPVTLDGRPALVISNDKLALTVRTQGGAMVHVVMKDDPDKLSPLRAGIGHFVCVDGFGPVSR